jgi:hypothetical protein
LGVPAIITSHRLVCRLGCKKDSVEVHRHDPAPLVEREVVPRDRGINASVVHEDVESTMLAERPLDHTPDLTLARHIDL